jgi:wyosine [tRNA(Phe)-imidazoG37] synthetase (radical SAM superfamily)
MSIVYGPVASWRLGRSLGVDMVSTRSKTCSFDCIYCQLGKTVNKQVERKEFVSLDNLQSELVALPQLDVDYVTFSGIAEPTLASNIGEAIEMVRKTLHTRIAVLTNSSLLHESGVRHELAGADVVVAKLDAPDDGLLQIINRPVSNLSIHRLLEGIRSFRSIFPGKLAIQMMFVEANREQAPALADIAKQLSPDELQINTPLRPCPVKPLRPSDLSEISGYFSVLQRVVTVYEAPKPAVEPLNQRQTRRRRPEAHYL